MGTIILSIYNRPVKGIGTTGTLRMFFSSNENANYNIINHFYLKCKSGTILGIVY